MVLLPSKYLVNVKLNHKSAIIYHSFFGRALVVSRDIVDLIQRFRPGIDFLATLPKEEVSVYRDAILNLKKQGFLVRKGLNERAWLKIRENKFKEAIKRGNGGKFIKALRLEMVSYCNFRCLHCFCPKIYTWKKGRAMGFSIAKQAVHGFINILKRAGNKNGFLTFWGGEPLLNWKVIQQVTEYVESITKNSFPRIQLDIITNASLLNSDKISFLKEHRFKVRLSLDGLEKENDRFRKFINGRGTFKEIVRGMDGLFKAGLPFSIELCLNDYNFYSIEKLIDFLWNRYKYCSLVVSTIDYQRSLLPFDTHSNAEKAKRIVEIYDYACSRGIWINPAGILPSVQATLKSKFISCHGCRGLFSSLYVNPSGTVYPCHEVIKPLAKVKEIEKIPQGRSYRYVVMRQIGKLTGCEGCEIEGFCAGGCAGIAEFYSGDIYDTTHPLFRAFYCDFRRHLFREMLKYIAKRHGYLR